jgi:hypothetical protein
MGPVPGFVYGVVSPVPSFPRVYSALRARFDVNGTVVSLEIETRPALVSRPAALPWVSTWETPPFSEARPRLSLWPLSTVAALSVGRPS